MPTRWIKMQLLLLTHALASAPRDHVLYVNEECGRADATSRNGAWRCADGSALPPPVVVVGSDGSGTRVVAKALSLMGVTMLVERSLYTQMVGTARPRAQVDPEGGVLGALERDGRPGRADSGRARRGRHHRPVRASETIAASLSLSRARVILLRFSASDDSL